MCLKWVYTHGLGHACGSSPCIPCTLFHKIVSTHSLTHACMPSQCVSSQYAHTVWHTVMGRARVSLVAYLYRTWPGHKSMCCRTEATWQNLQKNDSKLKGNWYPTLYGMTTKHSCNFWSLNRTISNPIQQQFWLHTKQQQILPKNL